MTRARPRALLAAAALAALLAGCLQPGSGGAGGAGGGSPSPTPAGMPGGLAPPSPAAPGPPIVDLLPDFALGPCVGVSVQSAQPLASVQAILPEGFTAAPFGTQDTGLAGLDVYLCGNLTTPAARIADTVYGQAYTYVQRPTEHVPNAPDAAVQEYVFRLLAAPDVLAALWPAAGYDTRNGTASVAVDAPPGLPDAGARLGSSSVGADYGSLADGARGLPVAWAGTFARYTQLADGSVLLWTGTYEVAAAYAGQGTFSVAADDRFAPFERADAIAGSSRLAESASMTGMDLRRVF